VGNMIFNFAVIIGGWSMLSFLLLVGLDSWHRGEKIWTKSLIAGFLPIVFAATYFSVFEGALNPSKIQFTPLLIFAIIGGLVARMIYSLVQRRNK